MIKKVVILMIDLKINQELNNFSSFNGIDEAFLLFLLVNI